MVLWSRESSSAPTDNLANALIGTGRAQPSRLSHAARRYVVFLQRVRAGRVSLRKIPDEQNPSDFLTKLSIGKEKTKISNEYATNQRNAVRAGTAAEIVSV